VFATNQRPDSDAIRRHRARFVTQQRPTAAVGTGRRHPNGHGPRAASGRRPIRPDNPHPRPAPATRVDDGQAGPGQPMPTLISHRVGSWIVGPTTCVAVGVRPSKRRGRRTINNAQRERCRSGSTMPVTAGRRRHPRRRQSGPLPGPRTSPSAATPASSLVMLGCVLRRHPATLASAPEPRPT
jgi:hypothetical protein